MLKGEKITVYTLSAKRACEKVREWYSDKKKLTIQSCIPVQKGDKAYEVSFAYDEDSE